MLDDAIAARLGLLRSGVRHWSAPPNACRVRSAANARLRNLYRVRSFEAREPRVIASDLSGRAAEDSMKRVRPKL